MSLARASLAGPPGRHTRRLLGLRAVADDHLRRADGALVAVLAADAPPLALRGPDEADRAIEALRLALAALAFPLQVLVELGPLDIEAAVAAHARATAAEPDARLRRLAADHRAFLRVAGPRPPPAGAPRLPGRGRPGRARPGRRPARPDAAAGPRPGRARPAPDEAARELAARCAELDRRLRPAGVAVRRLAGAELAGLLHRLVQPDLARRQPLPADLPTWPPARRRRGRARPARADRGRWPATWRRRRGGARLAARRRPLRRHAGRHRLPARGRRRLAGRRSGAAACRCASPSTSTRSPTGTALGRLERRKTRLEAAAAVDARQGRTAQGGRRRRPGGRDRRWRRRSSAAPSGC